MAGFVPKGKLSKKARKEMSRQRRTTWGFRPVTKIVESRKLYNRKKNARDRNDDCGTGVLPFGAVAGFMALNLFVFSAYSCFLSPDSFA